MALDPKKEKQVSKFISLVLRHEPEVLGLEMDSAGWVSSEALLAGLQRRFKVSMTDIEAIVANDTKGRYSLADGRIRANQGHSIPVDLGLLPVDPPDVLYHGTVARALQAIMAEGLQPRSRQHVHLSPDIPTARTVGARRGRPMILSIDAARLSRGGHLFYLSDNGVWLPDHVPPAALRHIEGDPNP